MNQRIIIDSYVGNELPADIEDQLAVLGQAEVNDFAYDIGTHLLLSVALSRNKEEDDRLLSRIKSKIDNAAIDVEFTSAKAPPLRLKNRRRLRSFYWFLVLIPFMLASVFFTFYSNKSDMSFPSFTLPPMNIDGVIVSEDELLRFVPVPGVTVELAAQSKLKPPTSPNDHWQIFGQVNVMASISSTMSMVLDGQASSVSGPGNWTMSANDFRDRIEILSGTPKITARDGLEHIGQPGHIWDVGLGGIARSLPSTLAARLPMSLSASPALPNLITDVKEIERNALDQVIANNSKPFHVPFMASPAYDLHLEIERLSGSEVIALAIPQQNAQPIVFMLDGWKGTRHGFSLDGSIHDRLKPTAVWSGPICKLGTSVAVTVAVRPDAIAVYINGSLLTWMNNNTVITPVSDLIWPKHISANRFSLYDHSDVCSIHRMSCFIHSDGVGAQAEMYGPQFSR